MLFAYFDGPDIVGKSTLRKEFATFTGEKYITFDRSPLSNFVYDYKYKRHFSVDLYNYMKFITKKDCPFKSTFILVNCSKESASIYYADRLAKNTEVLPSWPEFYNEFTTDMDRFKFVFTIAEEYVRLYGDYRNNVNFITVNNEVGKMKDALAVLDRKVNPVILF